MIEFENVPELRRPIMIAAFEGWNDAGDAASGAIEHLEQVWPATPFAAIDPEDYYDFQVNRPTVAIDAGRRHIEWPTTRFSLVLRPAADRDVVLVRGPALVALGHLGVCRRDQQVGTGVGRDLGGALHGAKG